MQKFRVGSHVHARALSVSAIFLTFAGCSGQAGEGGATNDEASDGVDSDDVGTIGGNGIGGEGPSRMCNSVSSSPSLMRRLTNEEYTATVRALLAVPAATTLGFDLPAETRLGSFENNAKVQTLSSQHVSAYLAAAESAASSLLKDTARRDAVVGCAPSGSGKAACVRGFIERFGRLAFRRPLPADEITRFAQLAAGADAEPDPYAGIERVLHAMLSSPRFLFLSETAGGRSMEGDDIQLDAYERATRLAFFLWGRGPDAPLLDAAAAGELDAPEGIKTVVGRMLGDARAQDGFRAFYRRWLGLERLRELEIDKDKYGTFDESLRSAMQQETSRFLDDLFTTGAPLDALVTAKHSFVDANLAKLYGASASSSGFSRTQLNPTQRGAGVLTQASVLALTGQADAAAPIRRGQYIREVLLCDPLPPPPPNTPALEEAVVPAGATLEERLAAHEKDPRCATCHERLDPLGFALNRYDGMGAYREKDEQGRTLSQKGRLVTDNDERNIEGPAALGEAVAASPAFRRCVATQAFRYAFAREEAGADLCAIDRVLTQLPQEAGLQEIVRALATSKAFTTRTTAKVTTSGGMP